MSKVFIVCGPTAAGKTTHAIELGRRRAAVRFSVDAWMATLFWPDARVLWPSIAEVDFAWVIGRLSRCETQVREVVAQLIALGQDVVLDLGFSTRAHRQRYREWAVAQGAEVCLHYLDLPESLRRARVAERNAKQDPAVFAFEVTDQMFIFMEPRFEAPDEQELLGGERIAPQP